MIIKLQSRYRNLFPMHLWDRDIYHKEETICYMEPNPVQLELEEKSITIRAKILEGVFIAKNFHGCDCYSQLLHFIREAFAPNSGLEATIFFK